jgi:hypothetical protein
MITFLENSEELETVNQQAAESGETEIPDNIKYHYTALVGCQDHNLYELDGQRLSPLIKGRSSKMGYILKEFPQMRDIVDSFTHGRIDCSVYKLSHSKGWHKHVELKDQQSNQLDISLLSNSSSYDKP